LELTVLEEMVNWLRQQFHQLTAGCPIVKAGMQPSTELIVVNAAFVRQLQKLLTVTWMDTMPRTNGVHFFLGDFSHGDCSLCFTLMSGKMAISYRTMAISSRGY
jgi:hypothetical protein